MSRDRKTCTQNGSTLIWVMVVTLVLTIIIAIGLTIVAQQHTKAVNTHINNQAYYTALSTTQTIEAWIKNGSAEALGFVNSLAAPGAEKVINFAAADLPTNTGSCNVTVRNLKATGGDPNKFKITSIATYQNSTETVSVVLEKNASDIGDELGYPVSGFNPDAKYGTTINQINNGTNGFETDNTPVNIAFGSANGPSSYSIAGSNSATDKRDFNPDNRAKINNIITGTNSTREATWLEDKDNYGAIRASGPRDLPYIDSGLRDNTTDKGPIAKMMMLAPQNGKLMINPVSKSSANNYDFKQELNSEGNIKFSLFPITDTSGKSVKLRLANSGTVGKRTSGSTIPHFSFIGLDFYDNKTTASSPVQTIPVPGITQESVTIDNPADVSSGVSTAQASGIPFYPNAWNDCTVYVKNNSGEYINSELDFGHYLRVHTSSTLDYRSWGNYITYHWGYKNQQYNLFSKLGITESSTVSQAKGKSGFSYPPVYWGNNFSMYILDGPQTSYNARIMQGVNLVNNARSDGSAGGVISTNRGLQIGGAFTPTEWEGRFSEGVYTILDGFDNNNTWSTGGAYALIHPQVIKDTDVVLTTNGSASKTSEILHPEGMKNFTNNTLSILGGTIYVGNKQTLQIDSETRDGLTVEGEIGADGYSLSGTKRSGSYATIYNYVSNGSYMYIHPKQIVVDKGGTLTIIGNQNGGLATGAKSVDEPLSALPANLQLDAQAGEKFLHDNVQGDIYVSGGTLNLENGATIRGNIYVYNGGVVNVNGNVRIDSLHRASDLNSWGTLMREEDGIIVYGKDAIGKNGITAAGSVFVKGTGSASKLSGAVISGSANKIHLMGKSEDLLYVKDPRADKGNYPVADIGTIFDNPAAFICDDYNEYSGECYHFGDKDNGWKSGVYADQ